MFLKIYGSVIVLTYAIGFVALSVCVLEKIFFSRL